MKINPIILLVSILGTWHTYAQKAYFQQDVSYKIDVRLDDESHILRGYERMEYTNNSKDTLKYLLLHLWPNAYKNDRTAFTAHQVENKERDFYFSKEDDRGFIDSLEFKVEGESVNVSEYNNHQDIVMLELNKPLLPGGKLILTTPFRVVVPIVFSRLGHQDQNYQITQWYPKPAVYDNRGWHPMPYLDQGEFYSEFGNFEVSISLPSNYIVAATGDLQEESERKFLNQQMAKGDSLKKIESSSLASSTEFKTVTFTQQHVHDFAWFASKYFQVEKSEALLKSGRKVSCYSYFHPKNARKYIESSKVTAKTIEYFSEHVGEYPYNQASVVDGQLLAGGGMEYPNVTIIGTVDGKATLQTVIIHEVGHNWFYGLLGSNEREYPWMDEGINSFYEHKLDKILSQSDTTMTKSSFGDKLTSELNGPFLYYFFATQDLDQPINRPAPEYTKINYGGVIYTKTALMLSYLEAYLGEEVFELAMKRYFDEWHFRHPYPEDFQKIIQSESGKKLDWFFDDLMTNTTKLDFKIKRKVKTNNGTDVFATSCTSFKGPIPVSAMREDSVLKTQWIEYPYLEPAKFEDKLQATVFRIDPLRKLPEVRISNNQKASGLLGLKLGVGTSLGIHRVSKMYVLPALGYNQYDKVMLGGVLHNFRLPNYKFQFALMPMYSFGASSVVGGGVIGYSFYPKNVMRKISLGLQGRTYHDDVSTLNTTKALHTRYVRYTPSIRIDFANPVARSQVSDQLLMEYIGVWNQNFKYNLNPVDSLYRPSLGVNTTSQFARASFTHRNGRTFHPYSYVIRAEGNANYLKLGFTGNLRIDYHLKNKSFYARVFGGKFFDYKNASNALSLRSQYLASTHTSDNDYLYDNIYLARNEQKGMLSQQIAMQEGGFKVRTVQYASPIGVSDNWLAAINLRSDLPIKFPVKLQVFLDAGTFANAGKLNPSGNKLLFDAGLELHLLGDVFTLYAPLFMSKDFRDYTKSVYTKNRLLNTMSFSLNLAGINFLNTNHVSKFVGF